MEEKFENDENCNPLLQNPVRIELSKMILKDQGKKIKGIKLVPRQTCAIISLLLFEIHENRQ